MIILNLEHRHQFQNGLSVTFVSNIFHIMVVLHQKSVNVNWSYNFQLICQSDCNTAAALNTAMLWTIQTCLSCDIALITQAIVTLNSSTKHYLWGCEGFERSAECLIYRNPAYESSSQLLIIVCLVWIVHSIQKDTSSYHIPKNLGAEQQEPRFKNPKSTLRYLV